jgi:hypothetical protein
MVCCEATNPAPTPNTKQTLGVEGGGFRLRGLAVAQPCLDELLGTLTHELRSPLATILSGVLLVAGGYTLARCEAPTLNQIAVEIGIGRSYTQVQRGCPFIPRAARQSMKQQLPVAF